MPSSLTRARATAQLLDAAIRIPGTRIRVGLDSLLGLIPGVGDMAGGAFGAYLLVIAARAGAPPAVLLRMLGNLGVDALFGTIPLLGDLFDVAFKANLRNLALLERYADRPAATTKRSRLLMIGVALLALLVVVGAVVAMVLALRWIAGQIS